MPVVSSVYNVVPEDLQHSTYCFGHLQATTVCLCHQKAITYLSYHMKAVISCLHHLHADKRAHLTTLIKQSGSFQCLASLVDRGCRQGRHVCGFCALPVVTSRSVRVAQVQCSILTSAGGLIRSYTLDRHLSSQRPLP
jgi:hypothetical protein